MRQCPACGSSVPEAEKYCQCGTDLQSLQDYAPAATPPAPSDPSSMPTPGPATTPGGAAQLTLKRGGAPTGETFPIEGRVVLGRFDPDSGPVDVDLGPLPESTYVSRRHAEIWPNTAGQWSIKDLGSRNGTFVRASGQAQFQRITGEQALNHGDEIAFGNIRFEFHVG